MAEKRENRAETEEKGKKKLRILLRTYGWPMDKLLHSDFTLLEGVV